MGRFSGAPLVPNQCHNLKTPLNRFSPDLAMIPSQNQQCSMKSKHHRDGESPKSISASTGGVLGTPEDTAIRFAQVSADGVRDLFPFHPLTLLLTLRSIVIVNGPCPKHMKISDVGLATILAAVPGSRIWILGDEPGYSSSWFYTRPPSELVQLSRDLLLKLSSARETSEVGINIIPDSM